MKDIISANTVGPRQFWLNIEPLNSHECFLVPIKILQTLRKIRYVMVMLPRRLWPSYFTQTAI